MLPEGGIISQCHTSLPLPLPLPQRLPEDVWTNARLDVTHPEPSGPSPGAVPVFIAHFISLVGRLNVSLQLKQDLDCLAFSRVSQNNLCCTSPGTQTKNMLWWSNIMSLHPYGWITIIICPKFKTTSYSLIHWFNSFEFKCVSDWNAGICCTSQNNSKQNMIQLKLHQFIQSQTDLNIRKCFLALSTKDFKTKIKITLINWVNFNTKYDWKKLLFKTT